MAKGRHQNRVDQLRTVLRQIAQQFPVYAAAATRFGEKYADEGGLRSAVAIFSCDTDKPRALRLLAHEALNRIYPETQLGTLDEMDAEGTAAVERAFALDRERRSRLPAVGESPAVQAYYEHARSCSRCGSVDSGNIDARHPGRCGVGIQLTRVAWPNRN